jgi:hypothetical protein
MSTRIQGLKPAAKHLGITPSKLRRLIDSVRKIPELRPGRDHSGGGHPAYFWLSKEDLETWFWATLEWRAPDGAVLTSRDAARILQIERDDLIQHIALLREWDLDALTPALSAPKNRNTGKEYRTYTWPSARALIHWWRQTTKALAETMGQDEAPDEEQEELDLRPESPAQVDAVNIQVSAELRLELDSVFNALRGLSAFVGKDLSEEDFTEQVVRAGLERLREEVDKVYKPLLPRTKPRPARVRKKKNPPGQLRGSLRDT